MQSVYEYDARILEALEDHVEPSEAATLSINDSNRILNELCDTFGIETEANQKLDAFSVMEKILNCDNGGINEHVKLIFGSAVPEVFHLQTMDADSCRQCCLNVIGSDGERNSFAGRGLSMNDAKQNAAYCALLKLYIFLSSDC